MYNEYNVIPFMVFKKYKTKLYFQMYIQCLKICVFQTAIKYLCSFILHAMWFLILLILSVIQKAMNMSVLSFVLS